MSTRTRSLAGAALLVAVLAGTWLVFGDAIRRQDDDLQVFLRAATRAARGENLYPAADGQMAFKYAPGSAFFFLPWAALPESWRSPAWSFTSFAAVAAALVLFRRRVLGMPPVTSATDVMPVALTLLASSSLLYYLAVNGQSDGVVLLAAVLAVVAVQAGWFAAAAAGWAVAAALKVAPAVLGLHLARRRPLPMLAWGAGAALAVVLLPLPFWGPARTVEQHRAWLERVGARTPGDLPYPRNHSIAAFVDRKLVEGPLGQTLGPRRAFALGTTTLSLAVLALGVWAVLRAPNTPSGRGISLAATLALAPPLTPVSWAATCVLLMPALLALQVTRTRSARADLLGEALLWGAALALNLVVSAGFQLWAPRLWAAFALLVALGRRAEALRGAEAPAA